LKAESVDFWRFIDFLCCLSIGEAGVIVMEGESKYKRAVLAMCFQNLDFDRFYEFCAKIVHRISL
jgi:hypothetical protein